MALERLENLSSYQTVDGLVMSIKVVSSSINNHLKTHYFSYLIDKNNKINISNEVLSNLKELEIEEIVIKVLENTPPQLKDN